MKKFLVVLITSIVFVSAIAQKSMLTMNLKEGQEYKQVSESKIIITQEINDQKIELTMVITGQLSFFVRSVNTDSYEMDVKYDRLGFTLEMPQGTAEFSSEKDDIDDIFSNILKSMKNKPFKVTMTKNGKIAHIADVDALWANLVDQFSQLTEVQKQQIKTQIMNAYGEKSFKGSIEMSTAIFPDKPVRKGQNWKIKINLESGMSALMTTKYTLVDITSDYNLIKGVSVIETTDKDAYIQSDGRPMKYDLKGSMISEIKVDPATGWTIEAKIDQDIRGDVYVKENGDLKSEIKIPMIMINKMTITN